MNEQEQEHEQIPESSGYLSADQILQLDDRRFVDVFVPEWNGKMRFKTLDVDEVMRIRRALKGVKDTEKEEKAMVRNIYRCAVDPEGNQLFTDIKQVEALQRRSVKVVMRLHRKCMEHNGMLDQTDQEKELRAKLAGQLREEAENEPDAKLRARLSELADTFEDTGADAKND